MPSQKEQEEICRKRKEFRELKNKEFKEQRKKCLKIREKEENLKDWDNKFYELFNKDEISLKEVKKHIKPHTYVDLREGFALRTAIQKDNVGAVEELLRAGANPNALDSQGKPPLYHALTANNSPKIVYFLLEAGADPNTLYQGQTMLYHAAENSKSSESVKNQMIEVMCRMFEFGADIDAVKKSGRVAGSTLLMHQIKNNRFEIAGVLLANGANIDEENNKKMTALKLTVQDGKNPNAVKWLIDNGAARGKEESFREDLINTALQNRMDNTKILDALTERYFLLTDQSVQQHLKNVNKTKNPKIYSYLCKKYEDLQMKRFKLGSSELRRMREKKEIEDKELEKISDPQKYFDKLMERAFYSISRYDFIEAERLYSHASCIFDKRKTFDGNNNRAIFDLLYGMINHIRFDIPSENPSEYRERISEYISDSHIKHFKNVYKNQRTHTNRKYLLYAYITVAADLVREINPKAILLETKPEITLPDIDSWRMSTEDNKLYHNRNQQEYMNKTLQEMLSLKEKAVDLFKSSDNEEKDIYEPNLNKIDTCHEMCKSLKSLKEEQDKTARYKDENEKLSNKIKQNNNFDFYKDIALFVIGLIGFSAAFVALSKAGDDYDRAEKLREQNATAADELVSSAQKGKTANAINIVTAFLETMIGFASLCYVCIQGKTRTNELEQVQTHQTQNITATPQNQVRAASSAGQLPSVGIHHI